MYKYYNNIIYYIYVFLTQEMKMTKMTMTKMTTRFYKILNISKLQT